MHLLQAEERRQTRASNGSRSVVSADNPVWQAIRHALGVAELGHLRACTCQLTGPCRAEAKEDAALEPILSSFLYASILSHATFGQALAFVLANRLSDATMLATELLEVFQQVMRDNGSVEQAALADVIAFAERVGPVSLSCSAMGQAPAS